MGKMNGQSSRSARLSEPQVGCPTTTDKRVYRSCWSVLGWGRGESTEALTTRVTGELDRCSDLVLEGE